MKVFYTDLSKKSDKSKLGFDLLKLSVILFILFLIILIGFEIGSPENMIGFYISMTTMVLSLVTFTCGLIISRMKITGEEDLRVFVQDKNDLYVIDKDGIGNDHFSAFRLSMHGGADELSILLAVDNMLSYNNERKERINESRNEQEIIENLKTYKHNKIKDIEIIRDNGRTIDTIIRTVDGARRKIAVANNYYNYEELFSIIRSFGGK